MNLRTEPHSPPPPYRHHKPTNSKLALSGPTPLLKWMQMYQKIKTTSHA